VLQSVFEQIRQRHEAIERLFCRSELDKHINITVRASLIAKHGSEERQPANTEAPNLRLNGLQAPDRLVTGEGNRAHVTEDTRKIRLMRGSSVGL
jgi:hypothetical protein